MVDEKSKELQRPLVGGTVGRRTKLAQNVQVPVGIEKLLYLAAKDLALKEKLLADREAAIAELGVALRPSEQAMLKAAPKAVLEAMIANIAPENPCKRRFMGLVAAAAASLAAGTASVSCVWETTGIGPGVDAGMDPESDSDVDAGVDSGNRLEEVNNEKR